MRNPIKKFWYWLTKFRQKCDYCDSDAVWEWQGQRTTHFKEFAAVCDRCADRKSDVAKTLRYISWSTTKL
jgi:hypothetical protein